MSDSDLELVAEFARRMGERGLRSITVSGELLAHLQWEASRLSKHPIASPTMGLTIAGVEIQMDNYLAVKANALADGMVEREPGHFVRP